MVFLSRLGYLVLTQIGDDKPELAVRLLSHKQPLKEPEQIFFGDVA